jgi:uncharacterized protein YrzB (UPF0473 family)
MAKLIRIEFMRRDNGAWMAYEKYEDGSEKACPIFQTDAYEMIEEMFADE